MFEEYIQEAKQNAGMKDIGLGEAVGKDELARKNIIAVNEKSKIHDVKISELAEGIRAIEEAIVMMRNEVQQLQSELTLVKAQANSVEADYGKSGTDGLVPITE